MNRLRFFLLPLLLPGVIGGSIAFGQGLVVYKYVDSSGRTTYSNQPIKGAVVVELSPLTVLPKAQTVVMAAATKQRAVEAQLSQSDLSEAGAQQPVALPSTSFETALVAAESAPATSSRSPIGMPSPVSISAPRVLSADSRRLSGAVTNGSANTVMAAQQRRGEIRRRIIEAEIDAEAELLAEAQGYLQREQAKSVAMRSLRTAIAVDERAAAGRQPLSDDIVATKLVVERHFERVRELQDQVLIHEQNLADLKVQLRAAPQAATLKTAATVQPTAIVATAQLGATRGQ